ncbi:hypothetical protein [Nocardia sp. NPDC020380]|uniref:hypothetical protein n=1 Tax=Nocardia sp. NPDC020380 TaxID=3364309 RepID=UPI0037A571A4
MADRKRIVIASEVQEILNYFGACPICGRPARARQITAQFDDGRIESQTIGECGGWCGWKGPVVVTTMTGAPVLEFPHGRGMQAHPPVDTELLTGISGEKHWWRGELGDEG